jgi:hypothetical protein
MATYVPLQSVQLTANTANVVFSGISQDYIDLVLVFSGQVTSAVSLALQINGDTTTNYSITELAGDGSVATSSGNANIASMVISSNGAQIGTGTPWVSTLHFQDYKNTAKFKTIFMRTSATGTITTANVGLWRSTDAINSIKIMGYADASGFTAGSSFDLYGIKAGTPKAQGGELISTDGTYWYHTFNSSGIFTVQSSSLTVDYLVLGGGASGSGGGSSGSGGGGGGGGSSFVTSAALTSRDYPVVVGAGSPNGPYVTVGNNSTFNSTTGGGGQIQSSYSVASPGGTGTTQNGGNGGIGYPSGNAQNGGAGYTSSISGSSVTRGGGGGGSTKSGTQGTGTNGGGNGVGSGIGGRGTANTGGGGGGSAQDNIGFGGGGGSGVVIVRYPV